MKILVYISMCLILVASVSAAGSRYKVLLVSMDGFRWDYIDKVSTPNFDAIAREGTKAIYVNNTFITKTFPCHYSIATESHGIVSNHMYDPVFDEIFGMGNTESKWWNGGNPLWVEVQRHRLRSGVYYWPGSESEIRGLRPNIYRAYNQSVPFKPRVDTVIDWLTDPSHSIDFAMLYFHEPDYTGHMHGPDSQEVRDKVSEMDGILGYIIQKFNANNLWSNVHLIITSDHGMAEIDVVSRSIDLSKHVDISAIMRMPDDGPITHIEALPGKEDELYRNLSVIPHMRVFKKQDIPDKWHYKNNRRILPILGVADEGWLIIKDLSKTGFGFLNEHGTHGYDNQLPSMKPIFYARGPNIKRNYTIAPFNSIDIYPLVADLLGFKPSLPINGTLDNTRDMLLKYPTVWPFVG